MGQSLVELIGDSHEEHYGAHAIFIERNRDHYRGGFEWSVCKDDVVIESGLEFSGDDALKAARECVDAIKL